MTNDAHTANPGPSVIFDGRKFTDVVCFVGKDLEYGVSAIKTLLSKRIHIEAIVGETASLALEQVSDELPNSNIHLLVFKRPWESDKFESIKDRPNLLGINCGFDYIIPESLLNQIPTLNIHPSALPLNRGCHHSFWGIIDGTPLGATLHWMTKGLDEGPIISQKVFADDGFSSAKEIQRRSNLLCLELLSEYIEKIMNGATLSTPQGSGSYHSKKEILSKSTLNVEDNISVNYLFNLCRATNNKGNGFFVVKGDRKFRVVIDNIEEVPIN